jgi:hypothetical protein
MGAGFLAWDFDSGIGAGVEECVGSAGVPITFKTGSGSPVCSLELDEDDAG